MKRTTVSLPEDLLARAQRIAAQRKASLGEVVRDALKIYVDTGMAWDPPRSLGVGDSGGKGRGRDMSDLPKSAYGRGPR